MSNRDKRDERKAKATGGDVYYSAERRLAEHSTGGDRLAIRVPDGVTLFKYEKDKTYRLAFLAFRTGKNNPYAPPGVMYYERTYYTHPRMGPNKDCVFCNAKNLKETCAACDEYSMICQKFPPRYDSWTQAQKDEAGSVKYKERQAFLVLDLDETGKGIQMLEISHFAFGKHLDAKLGRVAISKRDEMRQFYFPQNGYYLQVGTTSESAGSGSFVKMADIEFHKLEKAVSKDILTTAKEICLDDLVRKTKYAELKKMIHPPVDEDEEEEETINTEERDDDDEDHTTDSSESIDEDEEETEEESNDDYAEDDDEVVPSVGDVVTYLSKGVRKKAKVVKVKDEKAFLKNKLTPEGFWKPLDALTPLEVEEEEEKPVKKAKTKTKLPEPDQEDDQEDVSPKKKGSGKKPTTKPSSTTVKPKKPLATDSDEDDDSDDDDFDF